MEVAFHIYICIAFSVFGCNVIAEKCLTSSEGLQFYSRDTRVCCNGTLYDRNKNSKEEVGCCGGDTYRTIDMICCNSTLHERYIQGGENEEKEQTCCGSNIFQMAQVTDMSCCGNNFTKSDGCCNQTTPFNTTHSLCVKNKVVPLGHGFCHGVQFDKRKQKCCADSTLWNISSYDRNFRCCGPEVYDERNKKCCGGSRKGKVQLQDGQCCGTGLYNSSHELCCKRHVFPRSSGRLQCCGKGTYDPTSQDCCGGRPIKQGLQICCDGTRYTIDHKPKLHCCGDKVYFSMTHLCCENGIKIEKTSPNHTTCCKRNATFFSCAKQEKADPYCGRQSYDKQSDLCCNNEIHKGARKIGKQCCQAGTLAYLPESQQCCFNEVKRKTESCNGLSPPSPPRRIARQTSNLCLISSLPKTQRIRFLNSKADVCRKNGYLLKINNPITVSNFSSQLRISYLDVTVKANIYNSTNVPNKQSKHTLLIPSNCTNMEKFRRKAFLLLTDIVFHSSQDIVHLGDSDLIFPSGRNIVKLVKRRFKTCSSYIVRNIHKILTGRL